MILSKFFSKSKPIAFLCLVGYISLFFWWYAARLSMLWSWGTLVKFFLVLSVFFGINFIVKRNKINNKNTFAVFVFSMLCTLLPAFYFSFEYLIPAFFVVLGLRRLISLKTQVDVKKKIFDASLWFFVASLLQPYLALLVLLVFLGVLQYTLYDTKNLFIPFVAWACVGLFYTAYQLWKTDEWVFFYELYTAFGWNNLNLIWKDNLIFLCVFIPFVLFVFWKIKQISSKAQLAKKSSIFLIVLAFIFTIAGWLFSDNNEITGLGISFIPLSMLAGSSLETRFKPIVKELILWLLLAVSVYLGLVNAFI